MPIERIIEIKVAGFRGINEPFDLDLDHQLVLIYGPNAEGKTSIAEAVEWLLFGRTSKRDLASDNREEHQNSFRNSHYTGGSRPFVEATLIVDGQSAIVRRELLPNEDSVISVDGKVVPSLSAVGILNDQPYPTIPQHGLKSFIHTAPRNRWESFSKILGLQELARLKADLDEGTRNFRNSRSVSADNMLHQSRELVRTDKTLTGVQGVLSERADGPSKFLEVLRKAVEVVLKTTVATFGPAVEGLESLRAERESRVVDLSALSLPQFSSQLEADVDGRQATIGTLTDSLAKELPAFVQNPEMYSAAVRADFLERGLALISKKEPSICPFCGQKTLVGDVPDRIKHLLNEAKKHDANRVRADFRSKIVSLAQGSDYVLGRLQHYLGLGGDPSNLFTKARRLVQAPDEISETEAIAKELADKISSIQQDLKDVSSLRNRLEEMLSTGKIEPALFETLEELRKRVKDRWQEGLALRKRFVSSATRLRTALQKVVLQAEEVKQLERLIFLVRNRNQIILGLRQDEVLGKLEDLRTAAIKLEAELTTQRLLLFRDGVLHWYNVLNPNEPIRLTDIRESTRRPRNLDLEATSYGKTISAAASLSESHTNCVGLSVYLAQATSGKQPFRFVFIDDPVQSMDVAHTDRFIDSVIRTLLDECFQVILLMHQKEIMNSVFTIFKHLDPLRYEFYGYEQKGPNCKLLGSSVEEYLGNALSLRVGDSEKRRLAGNALRCATERLIKELYAVDTGTRLTAKHQKLSGDQLRDLLSKCPSVAADDVGRINELISRMNPRSHDRDTSEPPTSQEIQAMVDRISTIHSKYLKTPRAAAGTG